MELPFTKEQFLNVFELYNLTVFPIQIVFYLLAFLSIILLFKPVIRKNRIISATLFSLWIWIGIVYHILFFSTINKAAYFFGILFVIQAILFFVYGFVKDKFNFEYQKSIKNLFGLVFVFYALIIYPVLGYFFGHHYPKSPTFGLPCPTTIFTFGILLFTTKRIPVALVLIPLIWSIIGFGAAVTLTIYEDYGLLISGLISFVLILISNNKLSKLKSEQ